MLRTCMKMRLKGNSLMEEVILTEKKKVELKTKKVITRVGKGY